MIHVFLVMTMIGISHSICFWVMTEPKFSMPFRCFVLRMASKACVSTHSKFDLEMSINVQSSQSRILCKLFTKPPR